MAGWHSWQGKASLDIFLNFFLENDPVVVVAVVAAPAEGGYIQRCQLETVNAQWVMAGWHSLQSEADFDFFLQFISENESVVVMASMLMGHLRK